MWDYFMDELDDAVVDLQTDWSKIRDQLKNVDLSHIKSSELANYKRRHTTSLQRVKQFAEVLHNDYYCDTKLVIGKLKEVLDGLNDRIIELLGEVNRGDARVEETIFDTAANNISATYEILEEMEEFLNTSSNGVLNAMTPCIVRVDFIKPWEDYGYMKDALYRRSSDPIW